jgi:hypothetical protein
MIWTLAQDPSDVWSEYHCTHNDDANAVQKMDEATKKRIQELQRPGQ